MKIQRAPNDLTSALETCGAEALATPEPAGTGDPLERETGLAAASRATAHETPLTRAEFDTGFDRWFAHVWAYVGRRTADRALCERIVSGVLAGSFDVLTSQKNGSQASSHRGEIQELRFLKAASDRLIGDATGTRVSIGNSRR